MYGVAGEKRPILSESDAFAYNLGDPTYKKSLWFMLDIGIDRTIIGVAFTVNGLTLFWSCL
jgi:hypothetical protein